MTVSTDKVRADSARKVKWGTLLCSASAVSLLSALPLAAQAQDANEETLTQETVVVQGIRGSISMAENPSARAAASLASSNMRPMPRRTKSGWVYMARILAGSALGSAGESSRPAVVLPP